MNDQQLQPDRMAPHSVEAEESVLGAILLNPESINEVIEFLTPDDFFIVRNGWVYAALLRLHQRGEGIDNITLAEELRQHNQLDEVGGVVYITHLINNTPSSIYTEEYGRIVERASIRRQMLEVARKFAQLAHKPADQIDDVIDEAESIFFGMVGNKSASTIVKMDQATSDYYDQMELLYSGALDGYGLPTGLDEVDGILGGLKKQNLVVTAGRPGMGKTALALSIALHVALKHNKHVAIFSLEMGIQELVARFMNMHTGIGARKLETGALEDHEWGLFVEGTDRLSPLPIFLDAPAGLTPLDLRAKCRRLNNEHGLDLVIIDYIGLMSDGMGIQNPNNQISYITRQLKQLARELDVPVLALSQLNRKCEEREDKRPRLSDLRDSGSVEQDADIVMFVYRDEEYHPEEAQKGESELIIAKHRNGPIGTAYAYFHKARTWFDNIVRTHVNLNPD